MSKLSYTFPSLDPRSAAFAQDVLAALQRVAVAFNNPDFGTTALRPASQLTVGQTYFDTTLGKPVWWAGADWVDATGAVV